MKEQNTRGSKAKSRPGAGSARPPAKAAKRAKSARGGALRADWQTSESQSVAPRRRERQAPTLTEGFGAGTASNSGQGERKRQVMDPDHARLAGREAVKGGTKLGR